MLLRDQGLDGLPRRIRGRSIVEVLLKACRPDDLTTQLIDVEEDDIAVALLHLRSLLTERDEEIPMYPPL